MDHRRNARSCGRDRPGGQEQPPGAPSVVMIMAHGGQGFVPGIRPHQMPDHGRGLAPVEPVHPGLKPGICTGDPAVMAQMLQPRGGEEDLFEPGRIFRILQHPPAEGAVAPQAAERRGSSEGGRQLFAQLLHGESFENYTLPTLNTAALGGDTASKVG